MDKVLVALAIIGFLGLAALVAGAVLFPVFDNIFHDKVTKVSLQFETMTDSSVALQVLTVT